MRTTWIAVGLLAAVTQQPACKRGGESSSPQGGCHDKCGKGTRCDGEMCVVDYSQDICAEQSSVKEDTLPMKPPITSWGECWEDRNELPKFKPVDDSKIPQFDPNKARRLDMNTGDEQLSENQLMQHMRDIEYAVNECLSKAACYQGSSLASGPMDFVFRVNGDGKVDAITVTAPPQLSVFGIVPCVRKAVAEHQFPTFDGPGMTVKYNIHIGVE